MSKHERRKFDICRRWKGKELITYLSHGEWRSNEVERSFPNHQWNSYQSKPTLQISQMVKWNGNYFLPHFLFIDYLRFSKIHSNLYILKSKLFKWKWVLFLFSIVLEKWFLMVFFEFFKVNARFWLRYKPFLSFSGLGKNWKSTERPYTLFTCSLKFQ